MHGGPFVGVNQNIEGETTFGHGALAGVRLNKMPLGGLLRSFQRLTERQQAVFVQLMTMSAYDFLSQWFETVGSTRDRPRTIKRQSR